MRLPLLVLFSLDVTLALNILSPLSFNLLVSPIKAPITISGPLTAVIALKALTVAKIALLGSIKKKNIHSKKKHLLEVLKGAHKHKLTTEKELNLSIHLPKLRKPSFVIEKAKEIYPRQPHYYPQPSSIQDPRTRVQYHHPVPNRPPPQMRPHLHQSHENKDHPLQPPRTMQASPSYQRTMYLLPSQNPTKPPLVEMFLKLPKWISFTKVTSPHGHSNPRPIMPSGIDQNPIDNYPLQSTSYYFQFGNDSRWGPPPALGHNPGMSPQQFQPFKNFHLGHAPFRPGTQSHPVPEPANQFQTRPVPKPLPPAGVVSQFPQYNTAQSVPIPVFNSGPSYAQNMAHQTQPLNHTHFGSVPHVQPYSPKQAMHNRTHWVPINNETHTNTADPMAEQTKFVQKYREWYDKYIKTWKPAPTKWRPISSSIVKADANRKDTGRTPNTSASVAQYIQNVLEKTDQEECPKRLLCEVEDLIKKIGTNSNQANLLFKQRRKRSMPEATFGFSRNPMVLSSTRPQALKLDPNPICLERHPKCTSLPVQEVLAKIVTVKFD